MHKPESVLKKWDASSSLWRSTSHSLWWKLRSSGDACKIVGLLKFLLVVIFDETRTYASRGVIYRVVNKVLD